MRNLMGSLALAIVIVAVGGTGRSPHSGDSAVGAHGLACPLIFISAAYAAEPSAGTATGETSSVFVEECAPSPLALDLIKRLESESLEESMENLDCVGDYYCGYTNPAGPDPPFDDIRMVLSNRRFAKVYAGLKDLAADAQYEPLDRHFKRLLAQYKDILLEFEAGKNPPDEKYRDLLGRVSDYEGAPRTLRGTAHALRATAMLSAALGNTRMWPALKEAFKYPVYASPFDTSKVIPRAIEGMDKEPVFSPAFQGEIAFMYTQTASEAHLLQVGIDKKKIIDLVPVKSIGSVEVMHWRSRATLYDIGADGIDRSFGSYTLKLITRGDESMLASLAVVAVENQGQ